MAVRADRANLEPPAPPAGLPAVLTIEEAAAVLRIGRTKAYAMSREWRSTQGRTGLPVIDFSGILRVPRAALVTMIGVPVGSLGAPAPSPAEESRGGSPSHDEAAVASPPGVDTVTPIPIERSGGTARRRRGGGSGQLGLFGPPA